jgi:hypothetical protein
MAIPVLGDIIQTVGSIIDDLHTSGEEKEQAALERLKLVQEQLKAQTDINQAEASHASIFVAGWRPAVGWVCAFALFYASIFDPFMRFVAQIGFGYDDVFPMIDTNLTMQVLLGMLGLAGMRSWEGQQGVKRDKLKK